ncbi:hypothetical protein, partial [Chryseobacterium sp. SIMBA_028]
VQTQAIEPHQLRAYMELIQAGRQSAGPGHFISKLHDTYLRHVLVSTKPEFSGDMVRLLTNDVELLNTLAAARFNPP